MGNFTALVPFLVEEGINSYSFNADALEKSKEAEMRGKGGEVEARPLGGGAKGRGEWEYCL